MDVNLNIRSEILEYSLHIEKYINDLILLNLGIYNDIKPTRLFGNKSSITFKNKIDLLYDIDIISKEENSDLELLMNFRNKFLHVIECDSYTSVLKLFDNGLKNRFKLFLNEGQNINNEESCRNACRNLFIKNLRTIRKKVTDKVEKVQEKYEIVQLLNQEISNYQELFYTITTDILLVIENSELENEKIRELGKIIANKCINYNNLLTTDEKFVELKNKRIDFFQDEEKVKNLFGIKRIDYERPINLNETPNT